MQVTSSHPSRGHQALPRQFLEPDLKSGLALHGGLGQSLHMSFPVFIALNLIPSKRSKFDFKYYLIFAKPHFFLGPMVLFRTFTEFYIILFHNNRLWL